MSLTAWQVVVAALVGLSGSAVAIVTSVLSYKSNKSNADRADAAAKRAARDSELARYNEGQSHYRELKVEAYEELANAWQARWAWESYRPFTDEERDERNIDLTITFDRAATRAEMVASPAVREILKVARVLAHPGNSGSTWVDGVWVALEDTGTRLVEAINADLEATYPPRPETPEADTGSAAGVEESSRFARWRERTRLWPRR